MKKLIYYIFGVSASVLTSCSDEVIGGASDFMNGSEKTPLSVTALLDADDASATTRAAGKEFNSGDQLIAYLRHVIWDGGTGERTLVTADKSPLLVTFTKGSTEMTAYEDGDITPIGTGVALGMTSSNTKETADLTASPALYWDDFSNSATAGTDLRSSNHYLQSYYGYCYNGSPATGETGSSITTALAEATGVLGWQVQDDQTSGIRTSDLLWSAEQTPVEYKHAVADRKGLVLPYTHAMSKVTIEIVLNEGFDVYTEGENKDKAKAFVGNGTTPTLFANRATTTTAPTYTHSTTVAAGDDAKILMHLSDDEVTEKKVRVYEAVIAPTVMKAGNLLAQVTVDDNQYDIKLTDEVLKTVPTGATAAWSSQLSGYSVTSGTPNLVAKSTGEYSAENGGITLPGVNYRIKITLNKQKIEVKAYITDWKDVNASIDGEIMFDADVANSSDVVGTEVTSTSFDLWRSTSNTNAASYDADSETEGIQKASTYTYTDGKWVGSPNLYWLNGKTSYYFRALAKVEDPANNPNVITSVNGSQDAHQGIDLLWAQTSEHKGKDAAGNYIQENGAYKVYGAGYRIDPRTGDVPLTFEHAMSKVSVILKNDKDAAGNEIPMAARVDLANAKISIINLYDGGTINISTGEIESLSSPLDADPAGDPRTILNSPVDADFKWLNNIVIPQKLDKDRGGVDRNNNPSYYSMIELTPIYPSTNTQYEDLLTATSKTSANTSIGTGEPTYYLTSELEYVNPVFYTATDAKENNAKLSGAVSTTSEKEAERLYTYQEYIEDKIYEKYTEDQFSTIANTDAALKEASRIYTLTEFQGLDLTEAQFNALPDELKINKPATYYTAAEAAAANYESGKKQGEDGYINEGDLKEAATYFTYADYPEHKVNSNITQNQLDNLADEFKTRPAVYYSYVDYIQLPSIYFTEAMFNALPDALKTKPAVLYTQDEADAYNAALAGAVKEGDVKIPGYFKLPTSTLTPHTVGELKSAGNKIMLYVTLADGTIYSIDLATCKDSDNKDIKEWKRGNHYTYTISLQKEKITFRALIENWNKVEGGGKATLDWD